MNADRLDLIRSRGAGRSHRVVDPALQRQRLEALKRRLGRRDRPSVVDAHAQADHIAGLRVGVGRRRTGG